MMFESWLLPGRRMESYTDRTRYTGGEGSRLSMRKLGTQVDQTQGTGGNHLEINASASGSGLTLPHTLDGAHHLDLEQRRPVVSSCHSGNARGG